MAKENIENASVKIMRSYDYNHFEVCLSSSNCENTDDVDDLRKAAAILVDKAVDQYKIAREIERQKIEVQRNASELRREVRAIKENFPKSEWSPEQKAKVKTLEQFDFVSSHEYYYEDDFCFDDAPEI